MSEQRNDPELYSKLLSEIGDCGAYFLLYRDTPYLLKKLVKGSKALDYGCGSGHSTRLLKSFNFDVDGVDINKHMVKIAKEEDPSGTYYTIESAQIPKEDNYYDLVFASFVLQHISSKNELISLIKEIRRVLKQNGIFIAVSVDEKVYNKLWTDINTDFEENKNLVSGSIAKLQLFKNDLVIWHYYWSNQDYCEALVAAGFDIVCTHLPLGKDSDGRLWVLEKENPRIIMYVAKKVI